MIFVGDVYDFLDSRASFSSQMEFDNSGLQTGSLSQELRRGMVCLDVTKEVIAQAEQAGCELIVAHHPVLFRPRRQLRSDDPAWLLARHNISCIASHTPLDACEGGVNDVLAAQLGLGETERLGPFARLCKLEKPLTAKDLAALAAEKLGAMTRCCDAGRLIRRLAVSSGSGCHILGEIDGLADALLTGDADHHAFLEAAQQGLSLVAAGHFETEILMIPVLIQWLREAFPAIAWLAAKEWNVIHYE